MLYNSELKEALGLFLVKDYINLFIISNKTLIKILSLVSSKWYGKEDSSNFTQDLS